MKQRERSTRTDVQTVPLEGVRFPQPKSKPPNLGCLARYISSMQSVHFCVFFSQTDELHIEQ